MHQSDPTSMLPDAASAPTGPNAQPPWVGRGTAWLVYDAARGCCHCYWLVGPADDHLVEHAEAPSAAVAVEWARSRTPRARIRLPDHSTYWAGTDPAPGDSPALLDRGRSNHHPRYRATCPAKPRLTGQSPRRPERRYCWRIRSAPQEGRPDMFGFRVIRQYEQGIVFRWGRVEVEHGRGQRHHVEARSRRRTRFRRCPG